MKAFLVLDELNQFHWAMLKSVLLILALLYFYD
ncbi:putative membrane protein, partial [Acinetobacter baumannii 42057_3]